MLCIFNPAYRALQASQALEPGFKSAQGRSFLADCRDQSNSILLGKMQVAWLGHASTSTSGPVPRRIANLTVPAWQGLSLQALPCSNVTSSLVQITCRCRWVPLQANA